MIKISALNDESEEESGSEEEVTKEALEQIALQQYSKALDLQKKGNLKDATQLLKDLLDTELLYEVKKPAPGEKAVGPLFNLKYLCNKNLASMLASADDIDGAIDSYCAASELDDTDVTLWHRLGLLCMRAKRYEMALHAFQRGADRNPRHWPCLDKIVTLLLGLDYKEECISIIYDTLQLDPGYLRGIAYRKHIYTDFPYIRDFMKYLNPIYEWNENEDEPIEKESADNLIKEASDIHEMFIEQQKAEQFKYKLPDLKLKKPISEFTWQSVGDSLVHMHHYMTENFYSHACFIELVYEKLEEEAPMEVCDDEKPTDVEPIEVKDSEMKENVETEKDPENAEKTESELNENNNSDKDKVVTDTEKCESDLEMMPPDAAEQRTENDGKTNENQPEPKKKAAVRRRGSDLSFLQQWEWCNKRRSSRKKPVNRQDHLDDNIYDTLRRMVPPCLSPELCKKKENQARDTSPDTRDLNKLFEEKNQPDPEITDPEYFGTETEQKDVNQFINKYTEIKRDIIDMLKEYLSILAEKWRLKWPEGLAKTFIEANKCYNNHIDVPTCTDANKEELIHYATVNILVEEFSVNEKFYTVSEEKESHELCVVDAIGITLYLKPHIFTGIECLELILRQLWAKMHINILNNREDLALDCLYQLLCEFEAMGEHQEIYNLELVNFTFKPAINETEILANMKFLERNKKLATVMDLYDRGNYEEVLSIVIDSFEHFKAMDRNQEEEMSLDFAVQLSLILDTYWALDDVDNCFKWSLVCLHEALKHYFRYTSGSPEYDKWTLTVVKVLCCMEHILSTEGLNCLDSITPKALSQGLEDLIRIIGHQVETSASDMPLGTIIPWVVMHYIMQREEDKGKVYDKDKDCDDIPNPLLILFIAHEQLGKRGWCCKSDGKLLYFILDTVVPRLRSPALSKCLEQVCQCMEQCVFCLYGHPGKKNKLYKYLVDHNVTPRELNWERAQQVYEIFRPLEEPELEGKISGISADTEVLFRRILAQLPVEYDPQKYVAGIKNYIKGTENKLPTVPPLLPFKMKDIYFLLGDYYFKKEDGKLAVKYNILDVVVNNDRLKSWAEISLAKALNLERILHSCKNLNNEREFLNPAKSIIRCFKRALELDPNHCTMWIEYGMFVYTVHSFCSRLLKQASESLSMEDFESLEKQKEDMLDTTQKCFMTVLNDLNSNDGDKSNEDSWLHYYMLGKVAEKRNKPPSVYLDYYMKGVKSLQEADATYPSKINYSTPSNLCIEVLELHYRMHASILKYIEQHENKPIPNSVGKVFTHCIEVWKNGPYMKKPKKDAAIEVETVNVTRTDEPIQAANILKRSISDVGEEETQEAKLLKLEATAAKVRRSASYDTERHASKETVQTEAKEKEPTKILATPVKEKPDEAATPKPDEIKTSEVSNKSRENQPVEKIEIPEKPTEEKEEKPKAESDKKDKEDSSSSTSSSSSSDSSSSDSSSSSSDSSRDSVTSSHSNNSKPLSAEEIMKIVGACLDALEDCASRFPAHYKAIYRVAHYHYYYKKGKDIERCRDLMLATFAARSGQKLAGLFSERKPSNFFNNIWKIPQAEVDRAGGFAFHMSRAVLLTMEILKEIDDHKTLLDLSLQLQRIPELDKKYVRDSDREELSQQAFSLCVQSLKGQLTKFGQQPDLRKNNVEQQALKSLMLDIYRAYQRAQKQPNSKQFTNLLIEGYKLLHTEPGTETISHQYFVDQSMKFCQRHIQQLKYEATLASLDKSQTAQKKQVAKQTELPKPSTSTVTTKSDPKPPTSTSTSASAAFPSLPKMSSQEITAAFQNYLPIMNDPTQQTAALLSYLSSMNAYAGIPSLQKSLQTTIQNSYQNSFQAEFYRQFLGQTLASYLPPAAKKQKRAPKAPSSSRPPMPQMKPSKSFTATTKATPTPVITSLQKSASAPLVQKSSTLAPSMGTVLPSLPASLTANLTSYGAPHSSHTTVHTSKPSQAHMSSASTVSAAIHTKPPLPHQQVSPGKTLQEKLAERQKHLPSSKSHEISDRHKHPSKSNQEINASISKLPSSLTITKTSSSKNAAPTKKPDAKKSLAFTQPKPKPISSDEVIVLDDD